MAAVIEVGPAGAHAGARNIDSGGFGDSFEGAVATIAIEIAASKIVGDVEVRQAVRIGVAPSASEAEAVVFGVEAGGFGAIDKFRAAFIVKKKIGRAIACVEVRRRVVILIKPEIITVETEIDIEATAIIVVGNGGVRESALRRIGELEGVGVEREFSISLIEEERRGRGADHERILP